MNKLACLTAAIALTSACKSEGDQQKRQGAGAATTTEPGAAKVAADSTDPSATAVPDKDLDEGSVDKFVARWIDAQNSGDFPAYADLYAEKFTGVKRVGAKTTRYNRESWLADRKRMFKKEMAVEARDRSFNLSTMSGQVNFTQRFASGKFEDLGPKRILVVREGADLKIAQEEMLASDVAIKAAPIEDFYFLYGTRLVLPSATVPTKHGAPKLLAAAKDEVLAAVASVDPKDLTKDIAELVGQSFLVDGVCEAKVVGFELLGRVDLHFGTTQYWDCDGMESDCLKTPESEQAAEVFSNGSPALVAKLSDCEGTYARPASAAKVVVGDRANDDALAAKAVAMFGAAEDAALAAGDKSQKGWWKKAAKAEVFKHPKSGQTLVSVYSTHAEGCAEFQGSSWRLWSVGDGGKLKEVAAANAPLEILNAVDIDGDGGLEFIIRGDYFGTDLAVADGKTLTNSLTLSYEYQDCPC